MDESPLKSKSANHSGVLICDKRRACQLEGLGCLVVKQVDDVMRSDGARPECDPGVLTAYKNNYCHWQQISPTGQRAALSLLS